MRKREYESKLAAASRLISQEEKRLEKMKKMKCWTDSLAFFSEDEIRRIKYNLEWMKIWLHIIQTHKIQPKARKSDTLHDLYAILNKSYYD